MQEFVVTTNSGARYAFPYSRAEPPPCKNDRVTTVFVDAELGNEAFTYRLESGAEGSVHIDHVREFNEEPEFMADLLVYKLSLEARKRIDSVTGWATESQVVSVWGNNLYWLEPATVAPVPQPPAQTPTPPQLDFIEPTRVLPTDPQAQGFDDSECQRLICTLPPDWLRIGDTGQDFVSS